jgi:hypothetical protein
LTQRTPICDSFFQLGGNRFRDKLRVQIGPPHFLDAQVDFPMSQTLQFFAEIIYPTSATAYN